MTPDISNHVQQGLALLPEQYKNKPNITAVLTALLNRVQELENVFIALRDGRLPPIASGSVPVGIQLDMLGAVVGQTRVPGESDAQFWQGIQVRIFENNSQGNPETLISIARLMCPAGDPIYLVENFPGTVAIYLNAPPSNPTGMKIALQAACPDGVRLDYVETVDPNNAFAFDGGNGTGGLGDVNNAATGGVLASLI